MKKRMVLVFLALILASMACNLPWEVTPETISETTTPELHSMEPSATVEATPTDEPSDVSGTEEPAPLPIVYGDRTTFPATLVVLDPVDGTEIMRLDAPDFGYGGVGGVTESGVFYIDQNYQTAYHVAFDGTVQELSYLNDGGEYFEGIIFPSPDGTKVAHGFVMYMDAVSSPISQLIMFNFDGSDETVLVYETPPEHALRPEPIKWASDHSALYYINVIEGIEGYGGLDLYKIDLVAGTRETIFEADHTLCSTSVSPDETMAIRVYKNDPLTLVIHDFETGIEQSVVFPSGYFQSWRIVWAPDSSEVLVNLSLGEWENDQYSVIRVNPHTLDYDFIIQDDPNLLHAAAWQSLETIWLNDGEGTLWMMDAESLVIFEVARNAWLVPVNR